MKKLVKLLLTTTLCVCLLASCFVLSGCKDKSKTIRVCASSIPHAQILEECVKPLLKEKGYELNVKILDWSIQNDGVANGDYDANYFQHIPFLNTYTGSTKLFATCKVHYEPLGIYFGKASSSTPLSEGKTFEICNDVSNAVRAFNLLTAKGVIVKANEGDNYPVTDDEKLNFNGNTWTSKDGNVTVKLIAEELLVSSLLDYDFACLPCNTALTGNISAERRVAVEDGAEQVLLNANIIAARYNDYHSNAEYKAKIDALTEIMLSSEVASFVATKYKGVIICDQTTQFDLRTK